MLYEDKETKEVYSVAYSQMLQEEDVHLKKQIIVIGVIGLVVLVAIMVLFMLLLSGGTLTKILHNVVC